MIDTLKLNILDCSIDPKTQLVVEPSPYLHDSQQRFINYDLFMDSGGEIVQGRKAYLNKDKYNITIKPKYTLHHSGIDKRTITGKYVDGLKVHEIKRVQLPDEDFNAGIFLQTSLPRYFNDSNFSAISPGDEKIVLKQLEKDLWNDGIKTNIWNSNLSRIDVFSNLVTDENFVNYAGIFNILQLARMERFEYAGTTFLYRNGEQQICCYDKIIEMQNKLTEFKKSKSIPRNIMRIENRLLKKRKILSTTGFKNLKDLYRDYRSIKDHYRNEVSNTLFKYEPDEKNMITGNDILKSFIDSIEIFGKYGINKFLVNYGIESILKDVPIDSMVVAIQESEFSRLRKSRLIRSFRKAHMDLEFKKSYKSKKTNLILYHELKSKFFKSVA